LRICILSYRSNLQYYSTKSIQIHNR